jgi:HlyD family secretion protein
MLKKSWFLLMLIVPIIFSCNFGGNSTDIYTGVVEGTVVRVPALTGGKINSLLIDTGDEVAAGQPLAIIDTLELSYQRKNLRAMLLEIDNQRQIATTNLERSKKDLTYVKEKYQRFEDLLKTQSVTQQTVDDLRNQLQNAQAANQANRQQLGSIDAKRMQIEAQLQSINKKISDAVITAPMKGLVTEKFYEAGEAIPPLGALAEIIDLNNVWVKIYIAEQKLPFIKTGQEAQIQPDGISEFLTGTVSWINSRAEFTPKTILTEETRTSLVYAVKVLIKNEDGILKQGMPVTVQLQQNN